MWRPDLGEVVLPMTAVVSVRALRKVYGPTVAVAGIDLDVAEGEVLGVLGPNGSGKTTTVECIAGLRRPDGGSVRVLGLDPAEERRRLTKELGVQLQQAGLQAKLTVREAIGLYASFYDDPVDGVALAERLGLGAKLDAFYRELSGGQQQRLAICLALVGRPRIVLLDELSTGLDPHSRREVWDVVSELRERGATVMLVTHLMEEAQHLCDRIAVLDRGQIIALDTAAGIIARSSVPITMSFSPSSPIDSERLRRLAGVVAVREGSDGAVQLDVTDDAVLPVVEWVRSEGIELRRLRVVESTLDDAFVELVRVDDPVSGKR